MSISYIAGATNQNTTGTAISLTHGMSLQAGDVVLVAINASLEGTTVSSDSGVFTETTHYRNPDSATLYIWERVCTGSEGSSFSFTSSASGRWAIAARQYRGVDSSIWDVKPTTSNYVSQAYSSGVKTFTLPGITVVDGACAVAFMGDDYDSATNTYSSITNSFGNVLSPAGAQFLCTADKLGLSAGATGDVAITTSLELAAIGWLGSLKPASVGGGGGVDRSVFLSRGIGIA